MAILKLLICICLLIWTINQIIKLTRYFIDEFDLHRELKLARTIVEVENISKLAAHDGYVKRKCEEKKKEIFNLNLEEFCGLEIEDSYEKIQNDTFEKLVNDLNAAKTLRDCVDIYERTKLWSKIKHHKNLQVILTTTLQRCGVPEQIATIRCIYNLSPEHSEIRKKAEVLINKSVKYLSQSGDIHSIRTAIYYAIPNSNSQHDAINLLRKSTIYETKEWISREEDAVELESAASAREIDCFVCRREPGDPFFLEAIEKYKKGAYLRH